MERDKKHIGAAAAILLVLFLMSMLARSPPDRLDSVEVHTFEQHIQTNRANVGSVTVEIRPADETIAKAYSSSGDGVVVTSGQTRVLIDGDQLTINDKQYGTVDAGAFILVDDTGVYINNIQRNPSGSFVP